jgi:hypothetical protein
LDGKAKGEAENIHSKSTRGVNVKIHQKINHLNNSKMFIENELSDIEIKKEDNFFGNEIAEEIPESLPRRNTPYYQNPLDSFLNPPVNTVVEPSNVDDKELEQMAELEAVFLLTILKTTLAITKGGLQGYVFNDEDRNRLQELKENSETESEEAREILQRLEIAENLQKTKEVDEKMQKDFLVKVVIIDFKKKRREGKLKFDSTYSYLARMFMAGLMNMTGQNFSVISLVGKRLLQGLKR